MFLLEVGLFIWLLFEKKMATTWWGLQMLINYRYEGKSWRKIVMLKKSRGGKRYATRSTKTPESAHEKEKQTKSRGTTQTYLVDKYCLGVKDTFGNAGFSLARYQNEVRNKIFRELKPQECPIELAHQMIYQSIDYAAQFGFQPEKDFAYTQFLLAPRGELEEPYQLTYWRNPIS